MLRDYAITFLLIAGTLFVALAAIGILRMPDIFTRLHAASKAATLGVACLGYALVLHFDEWAIGFRALAFGLVLFLTTPISTHLIARAAFAQAVKCRGEGAHLITSEESARSSSRGSRRG